MTRGSCNRSGKSRGGKIMVAFLCGLAGACTVPGHMHVTEGISPKNVDTNVRFRTTYYFRVFDYCWSSNAALGSGMYRKIIPETDTVYRYRMTGKASALATQIKFESGVLDASVIDPFGTDVVYNADANGFLLRTPEETRAIARAADKARDDKAARDRAMTDLQQLIELLPKIKDTDTATQTSVRASIDKSLALISGQLTPEQKASTEKLQTSIDDLTKLVREAAAKPANSPSPAPAGDALTAAVADIKKEIETLRTSLAKLQGEKPAACSVDEVRRTGFQVMGPQGMHAFDQDKRLLMAMSTRAKPLIETLNEYAGRMLKGRQNPAELLLPLAQETTRIVETRNAVQTVATRAARGGDSAPKADDVFSTALTTFSGEPK